MVILAAPGERLAAFGKTFIGYPVTFWLLGALQEFAMRNRNASAIDDARWYLLFMQGGIRGYLILRAVRARRARQEA